FFLKEYFKDKIDLFGRGINEIEDKWDAIAPYKYHVVLENSCYDDYFSEKLSDAFLGEAYPIYSGASNVYSYFSKDSLVCIDIKKPSVAVKIIETIMANEFYEKYRASIIKSKMKVLNEYNLFPTVLDKFINIDNNMSRAKMEIVLKPEQYYGFKGIETRIGDSVKVIKKFTRADKNV
ncbi:glycosyltransferase family 10, partial [bacterium]|nr:glycosyltransferase family 10 [bacterium]